VSDLSKLQKFQDDSYREAYLDAHVKGGIAYQVQALREKSGRNQTEFGELIGKPQSVVSRLESTEYGAVNVNTLVDIANRLKIGLLIRFCDFETLTVADVSPEAFAVENACQLLTHQMPDAGSDKFVAIVDFGASTTTFSVLKDLKVIYTRDFAFGGQQLTEEIMRTYGLSMEDAGRAKKEGGLPSNYQPEVLDAFIDDMSQQVSRSLQFFLASGSGREQPDQILVCGGCANIPGVADVIGSRVGIQTQIGDPLGQMKVSSRAKSQGVDRDATALLTACGLALRSFD